MNESRVEERRAEIAAALTADDAQRLAVIAMEQAEEIASLKAQLAVRSAHIERTRTGARNRQDKRRRLLAEEQLTMLVGDTPTAETESSGSSHRDSEQTCHVTSRDVTLQPPSSPDPTNPLLTTTARAREAKTAETAEPTLSDLLVAGANRGLKARFGDDAGTIAVDAMALELAAAVEAHGTAPAEAITHVEKKARRCRRHPVRMDYFKPALLEFCVRQKGVQRAQAAERALPTATARASVVSPERAAEIRANRQADEAELNRQLEERWERKGRPQLQEAS